MVWDASLSDRLPRPCANFATTSPPSLQRELFLTGSTDGSVRMYSSLRMQPLLHLEPTSSYLFVVQWSPFRPLVFAAAAGARWPVLQGYEHARAHQCLSPITILDCRVRACMCAYVPTMRASRVTSNVLCPTPALNHPPGDGCVYLFDLARQQEVVRPVLTLDANGMRKPVYSLAFNPRKPDMLATGDPTGIQVCAV